MAFTLQLLPHLARTIDLEVVLPHLLDLGAQPRIGAGPGRPAIRIRLQGLVGIVGRRGQRQHLADGLDPTFATTRIHESHHQRGRRSSSARRTRVRRVLGVQPILAASENRASHWEPYSFWCSSTIRTARSRASGEYLTGLVMTPISQEMEPPAIPIRFILQGQFSPLVIQLLEPVETVSQVAQHLAGLRDIAQPFGQFQKPQLVLVDLLRGRDLTLLLSANQKLRNVRSVSN